MLSYKSASQKGRLSLVFSDHQCRRGADSVHTPSLNVKGCINFDSVANEPLKSQHQPNEPPRQLRLSEISNSLQVRFQKDRSAARVPFAIYQTEFPIMLLGPIDQSRR